MLRRQCWECQSMLCPLRYNPTTVIILHLRSWWQNTSGASCPKWVVTVLAIFSHFRISQKLKSQNWNFEFLILNFPLHRTHAHTCAHVTTVQHAFPSPWTYRSMSSGGSIRLSSRLKHSLMNLWWRDVGSCGGEKPHAHTVSAIWIVRTLIIQNTIVLVTWQCILLGLEQVLRNVLRAGTSPPV